MKEILILCSGGIDSTTLSYYIKNKFPKEKLTFLFFNYSQPQYKAERYSSNYHSKILKAKFVEINLPALANISKEYQKLIPLQKSNNLKNTKKESDYWYVPLRNTIFLAHALAYAELIHKKTNKKPIIYIGFKSEGKEPFPDTTKTYLNLINKLSKTASNNFKIEAPFINKDKEDIIFLAKKLNIELEKTLAVIQTQKFIVVSAFPVV